MLVYREQSERRSIASLLHALSRLLEQLAESRGHDDAVELLITAGQFECAVLDAMQPEWDAPSIERSALDGLSRAAGRVVACSRAGAGLDLPLGDAASALRWLRELALPRWVEVKTPEGYAWYAAHPEAWLEAARRATDESRPVVVVGLRSIGTSLSAMAAAAFESHRAMRFVIRPRGHPFDRRPRLDAELLDILRSRTDALFLVVDEGPGISGSSLTGVAEALAALGVPDGRIVLLPAWIPDASRLASERARSNWDRWQKIVVPAESIGLVDQVVGGFAGVRDWSAGAWRKELLPQTEWPPVQPQHERRKWRTTKHVVRFVGLGGPGREIAGRIERMHEAGFGPALANVKHGYAALSFVAGPLSAPPDALFSSTLARYLQWLCTEELEQRIDFDALAEMIEVNVREALGQDPPSLARFRRVVEDGAPVRIDGRLHRHEWVRTPGRWIKLDGFDHHADHFYPGGQDVAWDLAGIAAEHSPALRDDVLERLGPVQVPSPRLRFYDVAYGAFRVGYAHLATAATGGEEQARWRRERVRCDRFLREALARLG